MLAHGGPVIVPAVAQHVQPVLHVQPQIPLQHVPVPHGYMQEIQAQLVGAPIHNILGALHDVPPPPAPYIPAVGAAHDESDDDYQEPQPPVGFLE